MTFVQREFPYFLLIVFSLYWAFQVVLPRLAPGASWAQPRVWQNVLLAIASCVFYGWIHPWFLILLFTSATVDFFAAKFIEDFPKQKKQLLMVSMATNLGILGFFKYYNFFVENVSAAIEATGVHTSLSTLNIILPVGISFYTFQTMSYAFDVYKGDLKACRSFLDYVVYVVFFPQLVAGPIERAPNLLNQVTAERKFEFDGLVGGFGLLMWGAFKKICIADTIAPYVDEVFMTREPAFIMVLMAGFGFGVQMLADFAAYTDMARGSARMLGFHLVENFNRPYQSQSTPEFWRRWHISLSSWVGDYVYTPLLRSGRPSAARTIFAMMTTFFLVGLWHGASWNFIVLGLYNGVWMCIYTFGTPLVPRNIRYNWFWGGWGWVFHTLVVLQPTGLLFRERSLTRVWQHLSQPWFGGTHDQWIAATVVGAMALAGTLPINLSYSVEDYVFPRLRRSDWWLPIQTTFWAFEALAIYVFYRDGSNDFIYFQF
jgi:alginate O-acetyltransferase complex protein AlgI